MAPVRPPTPVRRQRVGVWLIMRVAAPKLGTGVCIAGAAVALIAAAAAPSRTPSVASDEWTVIDLYALADVTPTGVGNEVSTPGDGPVEINDRGQIVGSSLRGGRTRALLWQRGKVIALGSLGGRNSEALAINERGQVAGRSDARDGSSHAFLWQAGKMVDLGSGSATAINERGQVAGESERVAVLWSKGTMKRLIAAGSTLSRSWAVDINERGQVAGDTQVGVRTPRGFLWQPGRLTYLAGLGRTSWNAIAVNDRGQVIGDVQGRNTGRAIVWRRGAATDLGSLGGERSAPSAINERGQIVGFSDILPGAEPHTYHAFQWANGHMIDLGPPGGAGSRAFALNERGQIVGSSLTTDGFWRAVVWKEGVMVELPTLGGSWNAATAINERGQIVGWSTNSSGARRAVMWEPTRT